MSLSTPLQKALFCLDSTKEKQATVIYSLKYEEFALYALTLLPVLCPVFLAESVFWLAWWSPEWYSVLTHCFSVVFSSVFAGCQIPYPKREFLNEDEP